MILPTFILSAGPGGKSESSSGVSDRSDNPLFLLIPLVRSISVCQGPISKSLCITAKVLTTSIIKGIGPARQRWLKESLDVHTFRDLATLSVGETKSRLKADKQIASRETIEVWIAEADRRAAKAKRAGKADENNKR